MEDGRSCLHAPVSPRTWHCSLYQLKLLSQDNYRPHFKRKKKFKYSYIYCSASHTHFTSSFSSFLLSASLLHLIFTVQLMAYCSYRLTNSSRLRSPLAMPIRQYYSLFNIPQLGQQVAQLLKLPLRTLTSLRPRTGVPGFKSWLHFGFQLPAKASPGRQQVMDQNHRFLQLSGRSSWVWPNSGCCRYEEGTAEKSTLSPPSLLFSFK